MLYSLYNEWLNFFHYLYGMEAIAIAGDHLRNDPQTPNQFVKSRLAQGRVVKLLNKEYQFKSECINLKGLETFFLVSAIICRTNVVLSGAKVPRICSGDCILQPKQRVGIYEHISMKARIKQSDSAGRITVLPQCAPQIAILHHCAENRSLSSPFASTSYGRQYHCGCSIEYLIAREELLHKVFA